VIKQEALIRYYRTGGISFFRNGYQRECSPSLKLKNV
jgi:hypothetical protein